MTFDQVAAAEKIVYHLPIAIVERELRRIGIKAETDIRIYPHYPEGWHATVGANNRVYIFTSDCGNISMEIEPMLGFAKNGSLIRNPIFLKGEKI